jgi:hypothetical protein
MSTEAEYTGEAGQHSISYHFMVIIGTNEGPLVSEDGGNVPGFEIDKTYLVGRVILGIICHRISLYFHLVAVLSSTASG